MEVTEIILAEVSRLCQLSSHRRRFLSRLKIFKCLGPSRWTSLKHMPPSYDIKVLLKVVFDKTLLVKFKISNYFKQNIDETHSKQPKIHRKIHTGLWILKSQENIRKVLSQMFVISKKRTIP